MADHRNNNSFRCGATLLELLIAMVVAALVISLSFISFSGILNGFLFQNNRAVAAREIMRAKLTIETALSGISSVQSVSDNSVTCTEKYGDTPGKIFFVNDSIHIGGRSIYCKIKNLKFSLFKNTNYGSWVLLWDAQYQDGKWFGGAIGERQ
jgi:hypothetical protein